MELSWWQPNKGKFLNEKKKALKLGMHENYKNK